MPPENFLMSVPRGMASYCVHSCSSGRIIRETMGGSLALVLARGISPNLGFLHSKARVKTKGPSLNDF